VRQRRSVFDNEHAAVCHQLWTIRCHRRGGFDDQRARLAARM
jgi:hypothetical protein